MSRAALEDQEESANHHHLEPPATDIHLHATSGSSKQESLFHRAERAIKETMSSLGGKLNDEEESVDSVTGGVEADPDNVSSTLKKTKQDDNSESDESSEEKINDDWYNKQIKESLKEAMERATGNADPSAQKSIQATEEYVVKAASGFVDRIETAFSSIIEQLHLHSEPQPVRNSLISQRLESLMYVSRF